MTKTKRQNKKRKITIIIIIVFLAVAAGVCTFLILRKPEVAEKIEEIKEKVVEKPKYYSRLTGLEIESEELNNSPLFCMQIPNGNDGGRPQVGLNSAGIVYEAIAEAGITRFSAIFQNADDSMIGPVRSIRPYYIEWDAPYDCTLVHSGSSDEALEILNSGSWKDLKESKVYMWRDYSEYRAPNNLFTSGKLMDQFNADSGFGSSNSALFKRQIEASAEPSSEKTEVDDEEGEDERILEFSIAFSSSATYAVNYKYDEETNSYYRTYQNGDPHYTYQCKAGLDEPDPVKECEKEQVHPSAVVAMMVSESTMPHGRESIDANSSGKAYFFQNGEVTEGTWKKSSRNSQIVFKDATGEEFSFTPGQLWISAVPSRYGKVLW